MGGSQRDSDTGGGEAVTVAILLISLPISAAIVFGTMYVARSGVVDWAVEMVVRVMEKVR